MQDLRHSPYSEVGANSPRGLDFIDSIDFMSAPASAFAGQAKGFDSLRLPLGAVEAQRPVRFGTDWRVRS